MPFDAHECRHTTSMSGDVHSDSLASEVAQSVRPPVETRIELPAGRSDLKTRAFSALNVGRQRFMWPWCRSAWRFARRVTNLRLVVRLEAGLRVSSCQIEQGTHDQMTSDSSAHGRLPRCGLRCWRTWRMRSSWAGQSTASRRADAQRCAEPRRMSRSLGPSRSGRSSDRGP